MADPISMIAIGATVAGGLTTAYGQAESGEAQQKMANYQAAVARQNAAYIRGEYERKAAILGMQQRVREGQITVAQGASGLDVGRGSAPQVRASQRAIDLMEQQDVRRTGARKAYAEETQATLDVAKGAFAKWGGDVAAVGTVLGTAGSVASKWYQASTMYGKADSGDMFSGLTDEDIMGA